MSDLPSEVIEEIFTCLPVKSLLRFRCVSKSFRALIDSTDFIKSHLDRTLKSTSQQNIIVRSYSDFYSLDLDLVEKPNLLNQPSYFGTEVLGHSNGLLCLLAGQDIFIWNPWTRVHKKLPVTEIEFPRGFAGHRIIYGFGYDGVNDDYKVVRIVHFLYEVEKEVKVYSVKSDSWRRIKDFPYLLRYTDVHGVLVSGALHWVVIQDCKRLIASFDIATEEYHLIPQSDNLEMGFKVNVGEVGGKLVVRCQTDAIYMEVWVMNNYGVRESWSKLFSVRQSIDPSNFEYPKPIAYTNDGGIVLLDQGAEKLLWYDLKLKILKVIRIAGIPRFSEAVVCMQSLVKLPDGAKQILL